jgi:hypothetical protein
VIAALAKWCRSLPPPADAEARAKLVEQLRTYDQVLATLESELGKAGTGPSN